MGSTISGLLFISFDEIETCLGPSLRLSPSSPAVPCVPDLPERIHLSPALMQAPPVKLKTKRSLPGILHSPNGCYNTEQFPYISCWDLAGDITVLLAEFLIVSKFWSNAPSLESVVPLKTVATDQVQLGPPASSIGPPRASQNDRPPRNQFTT